MKKRKEKEEIKENKTVYHYICTHHNKFIRNQVFFKNQKHQFYRFFMHSILGFLDLVKKGNLKFPLMDNTYYNFLFFSAMSYSLKDIDTPNHWFEIFSMLKKNEKILLFIFFFQINGT